MAPDCEAFTRSRPDEARHHARKNAVAGTPTLRTAKELVDAGFVDIQKLSAIETVASRYAIAVTPAIASLIDRADPLDPIARQFLPTPDELNVLPQERLDPIGDAAHSPVKGIVHRYPDRVLLKPLHACPVYCRFCFRREQVGPGGEALSDAELGAALAYIEGQPKIWEVILTGGDPLMLSPRRLGDLLDRLSRISHVGTIRIHSRVPVVDPQRIGTGLVRALRCTTPVWLAVHANHPREFSEPARAACRRIADVGVPLLGQTVLLRGVNDDIEILEALFRTMIRVRIKPYYLHHPDLAPGTAHFRLPIAEGQTLMRTLRQRLSGIAQPTYVLDVPDGAGKVPIGPNSIESQGIRDIHGQLRPYPEIEDLPGTLCRE